MAVLCNFGSNFLKNMEAIRITACGSDDWEAVQAIGLATFTDTYEHKNSPENFRAYVSRAFSNEKIREELVHPHSYFYFVKSGSETIGYLKLNEGDAQTETMGGDTLEIERIYVVSKFKGGGIGRQMVEFAEQTAREKGKSTLWLGVWNENPAAIAFYQKMGFEAFGNHIFTVGDDEQEDILFRKMVKL